MQTGHMDQKCVEKQLAKLCNSAASFCVNQNTGYGPSLLDNWMLDIEPFKTT